VKEQQEIGSLQDASVALSAEKDVVSKRLAGLQDALQAMERGQRQREAGGKSIVHWHGAGLVRSQLLSG